MNASLTAPASTVVPPNAADAYWLVTEVMEPLISTAALDVVRVTAAPNGGPPPHRHSREDELFYVVDGTFEFTFGDGKFTAGAGTAIYLPRNIIHTYNNVGKESGQLIVTAAPAGFIEFITQTGDICLDKNATPQVGPAVFEKLGAGCAKAGIELLPAHVAKGVITSRPQATNLWVLGLHVRILLSSEQTDGYFSVAEITAAPGDFVPPHRHLKEDEVFYVTEGTIEFDLAEGVVTAPAGTFVHVPANTLHGFRNSGRTKAKMLDYHTPGGFEKFFHAAGVACTDIKAGPPKTQVDMERMMEIFRVHGMEM